MVLSELRRAKGLSQYVLAAKTAALAIPRLGITRAAITHFESGRRIPMFHQMRALQDVLQTTPREIRLMVDSAGVDDVRYLGFSLNNRGLSDEDYMLAWEQLVATVIEPILPETIPAL
jgi:transcriptional regulator with XRE-family HTH domain